MDDAFVYEAHITWKDGTTEYAAHSADKVMLAVFCRELLEKLYGLCDELAIDDGTAFKHPRSPHADLPDVIICPVL